LLIFTRHDVPAFLTKPWIRDCHMRLNIAESVL
jgi:hypothetical protein